MADLHEPLDGSRKWQEQQEAERQERVIAASLASLLNAIRGKESRERRIFALERALERALAELEQIGHPPPTDEWDLIGGRPEVFRRNKPAEEE